MISQTSNRIVTDKDLENRVVSFFRRHHLPAARSLKVESQQGVITLRGRVPNFHQRQRCIECCKRVAGVVQVNDQIEVEKPAFHDEPYSTSLVESLAFTVA
jgi:osmotically-inducible protein OsmY